MIFKVTFGFRGMGVGWSETHAAISGATDPKTLAEQMKSIAQKRVQMLGREFEINAIRISRYSTDDGVRQRGVNLVKQIFKNSSQSASAAAEPAVVALLVRGTASPNLAFPQFNANQNQTFLGAPLDVCVDNGGVVDPSKGGLGAAFATWRDQMVQSNMGWLANETIAQGEIATITQNANGTVKFTFTDPFGAPVVIGGRYRARCRQINGGSSPLNGELIVTAKTLTELNTFEVIGLARAQVGGFIRLYRPVSKFIDYGDLELTLATAKHQRGRPFGSVPGRARKRIRG